MKSQPAQPVVHARPGAARGRGPCRERRDAHGVGLVDVGVLAGLPEYYAAGQRLWNNTGTRGRCTWTGWRRGTTGNEGFGPAYSLPNISAYSETCAVLMFSAQSASVHGHWRCAIRRRSRARHYNNAIDGVFADRQSFLLFTSIAWRAPATAGTRGGNAASLECCPPNLVRFLAGMPGLVYAQARAQPGDLRQPLCVQRRQLRCTRRQDLLAGRQRNALGRHFAHRRVHHRQRIGRRERAGGDESPGCRGGPGTVRRRGSSITTSIDSMPGLRSPSTASPSAQLPTSWATSRSIASGRRATPSPSSFRFSRDGSSLTIGSLTRGAGCRSSAVRLCTAPSGRTSTRAKRSTCSSLAMRRCVRAPTRVPSAKQS